ncbi:hypothetical protein BRADI_2g18358v3 [Brachypodium distachyon]|uniref:Uncharacterized protein n=1 Tax=Brachypodium distachyon TaxID=15368 RepID=A0A0Q3MLL7_BRADI|nr:hypothetical protein BRADI_2g18358v3 [Brachypodium distachyon]
MSKWLVSTYNTDTREWLIPENGSITVIADSIYRNFKLPNRGSKVIYKKTQESVDFISKEYGHEGGKSPEITDWCRMIIAMNGKADDKFLRAWLIAAMSCLLCPTTSLHVSPRCYPNFINLDDVVNINFCEFVVHQIHEACLKLLDKNSAKCCVYPLLILYLDSLDIDEDVSNCPVRAEAWTPELINKAVQLDTKADGGYGKLKLGKFVEGIGELHNEEMKESNEEAPKKRRQRNPAAAKVVKKKKVTQKDAQQGQDATVDGKATDKLTTKERGQDVAAEDVDEEKEQDDDEEEVADDDYHGPDRGDDGDGGQGSEAKSKGAGQTDAILGSWLRNSTKTKRQRWKSFQADPF